MEPGEAVVSPRPLSADERNRVLLATDRLRTALMTRTPCSPVRDLIGADDLDLAYAVQQQLIALVATDPIVGRKIGATSAAVQEQLGVDQPDFGVLTGGMQVPVGECIPMGVLLQPKVEAEIAFVLRTDLDDGDLDLEQMANSVEVAMPAIEVVDSRIRGWDISFADTVADNASSGLFVLGESSAPLSQFSPIDAQMEMRVNDDVVSRGEGRACLGDPLSALSWLARCARDFGQPLRAGQIILSGALGPMHPIQTGDHVTVEISGLGRVEAVAAS